MMDENIKKIRAMVEGMLSQMEESKYSEWLDGVYNSCKGILSFLSDLEKSLPAKVADGEELENELVRFYLKDLCASEDDELTDATRHHHFPIMWDDLRDIARHFYDLGCRRTAEKYDELEYNRQRAEESPLPEDTVLFNKGIAEGRRLESEENKDRDIVFWRGIQYAREMMMKEAVEGEVMLNPYPTICLDDCKDYDFKDGDKVRIIIVKEN